MIARYRAALLTTLLLVLAACQGTPGAGGQSPGATQGGGGDGGEDYLARIRERGTIVAFTDPAYPPQSFLNEETGDYEGFDIDVTREIASRLGVEVEFTTPPFDAVVAGNWSERWDIAVGSVTVTEDRKEVLDFTEPYYFTPAQLATFSDSDIQSIDDFSGTTICVGEATTYLDWIEGDLTLPEEAGEVAEPPADIEPTTLPTDLDCAESWRAGRTDFEGWISSITTVQGAINEGYPVRMVGDPIFFEPLAVAFDASVEDNDSLVAEVDRIIGEMHEDGTLSGLSEEWFDGQDLTTTE